MHDVHPLDEKAFLVDREVQRDQAFDILPQQEKGGVGHQLLVPQVLSAFANAVDLVEA